MNTDVLVTGAAGALGREVVTRFLDQGAGVLAVDVTDAALEPLAQINGAERLACRSVDLLDSEAVRTLFAELSWGPRPSVVHLVGGFDYVSVADCTDAQWQRLLDLNLGTTLRVLRESARSFATDRGGVLLAVSSPFAVRAAAGVGAYAAVKAGVLRLVEAWALEMASFGGRANAVLPGTMDTPANRAAMPDSDPKTWVDPAAVARVIHFLTTEEASSISGAAIPVPGPTLS